MERVARFTLLLLTFAIFPSACVFSQETGNKPSQSATPAPATTDSPATKVSRTHCEVLSTCVQKVLYLTNLSQPTELQDLVNAIRVIAEVQRVQQILAEQILVIEGTADQVAMAEKLATEIDKDKRRFGGLGYRIELKTQESAGDKKLHSHVYSFVTEPRQDATVNVRKPVPPVPIEPGSEPKPPTEAGNARNIDCRIISEHEHTLDLKVEAAFASDTMDAASDGIVPTVRTKLIVTVELDRPTVITRIDDPDGNHSFTIELTATRLKD